MDGVSTGGGISVSDPSDRFERAAATNAEHVMAQPSPTPAPTAQLSPSSAGVVQRAAEEEEEVQAAHDSSLPAGLSMQREEAEEEEPTS